MTVVSDLVELLALAPEAKDEFVGQCQDLGFPKLFGGQVVGQALSAASQTVSERAPHSCHAYFIRAGRQDTPVRFAVERVRDGGSFSVRRVVASQNGDTILVLTASFHKQEAGFSHQGAKMPEVPGPEHLISELDVVRSHADEIPEQVRHYFTMDRAIEYRIVEPHDPFRPIYGTARRHVWIRACEPLPDNPLVHQSMFAYTSDHGFLETALVPRGAAIIEPRVQIASLDHAIWFHRPFKLDEWLLYVIDSPSSDNARSFVRGEIFNQAGVLVASTAQEGLIRIKGETLSE